MTDVSGISLSDIFVSGPRGEIADVYSNSVSTDVKLVPGVFFSASKLSQPF